MTNCPCCSGVLLRHVRHDGVYWFCMHCWQEMPDLSSDVLARAKSMPRAHYRSASKALAGDRSLPLTPDHQSENSTTERHDLLVEQRSLVVYH
uniref:Uncharacterized protein n=1 Tax=Oscillatoriales cyanobacterium SpSt-418 TaxID=2282169 RepID=A0A7C3KCH5_9CYAN